MSAPTVDLVFTLPLGAEPARPKDVPPVEWGSSEDLAPDGARLEEIECFLMERGFDSYFSEIRPGGHPLMHLVFSEPDESREAALTKAMVEMGCRFASRTEKAPIDWIKNWVDTLTAFELVPGFWVNPWPDRSLSVPPGAKVLRVVPGFAFGTGHHATTRLAAALVYRELKPGHSVLDVGCGTAILSILAKGLGAGLVWGCDNDASAVTRARETAAANGEETLNLFVSDLLAQVPGGAPFDLVVANIISDILIRLLDDVRLLSLMAPGGKIILSGIHTEGKGEVAEALTRRGLTPEDWISEEGWWAVAARGN